MGRANEKTRQILFRIRSSFLSEAHAPAVHESLSGPPCNLRVNRKRDYFFFFLSFFFLSFFFFFFFFGGFTTRMVPRQFADPQWHG